MTQDCLRSPPTLCLVEEKAFQWAFPRSPEAGAMKEGQAVLEIKSLRTVGLSSSVIGCGIWQTLDTIASRQRPGNSTHCMASLPSLVLEKR